MKKLHTIAAAAAVTALTAVPSFAVTSLDFTAASASITGEITGAISAAMPILGLILACVIGVKVYKRFAK